MQRAIASGEYRAVVLRVWCHLGAALLSAALMLPAFAGTNTWSTNYFPTGHNPACRFDSPSIAAAVACTETYPTVAPAVNCPPAFKVSGPTFNSVFYVMTTRIEADSSDPFNCASHPSGAELVWQFTESCGSLGKVWNDNYGGCVEDCDAPQTLNMANGECQSPPSENTKKRNDKNGRVCKANPCE